MSILNSNIFNIEDETLRKKVWKKLLKKAFYNLSTFESKDLFSKTDFKCAWLYLFGYKISKLELQEYFEKLGKDYHKDAVNYDQFEQKAMSEVNRLDLVEELRNFFIAIDFSCKGFLTIENLLHQFKIVSPKLAKNIVIDTFKELDRDDDGRVSYKDFEIAMQYIDDD